MRAKYLVEEVRALAKYLKEGTPNWYRESFGDFKSSVHTCDNAPKNAVAMLTAYADLREQIERAREGVTDEVVDIAVAAYVGDKYLGLHEQQRAALLRALQSVAHLLPSGERDVAPAQAAQVDMHPKHGDMHDGCGGYWCDYVQAEYKKPGPITLHESNIVRYVKLGLMCDKCGVERPTAEPVAQGEAEWLERLKDPETVHALMLRGVIAVPSIRSMVDLRGEVPNVDEVQLLRIAELQEQIAAHLAQPRAVPDGAWPKMELWFFRDLTSAQRLALFALHSLPVDEIGESHVNQKRMLRHLLTATPLPAAQPRAVPDARVASFVEEAGRIISGASFPSGRSLAKAREVCDLALTMLAAAPSPGESE